MRSARCRRCVDIEYRPTPVAFTWIGFGEGNVVSGEGNAVLPEDGSIEIVFEYETEKAVGD